MEEKKTETRGKRDTSVMVTAQHERRRLAIANDVGNARHRHPARVSPHVLDSVISSSSRLPVLIDSA